MDGLMEWTDGMEYQPIKLVKTRHRGHGEVVSAVSTITSTIIVRETIALLLGRLCLILTHYAIPICRPSASVYYIVNANQRKRNRVGLGINEATQCYCT